MASEERPPCCRRFADVLRLEVMQRGRPRVVAGGQAVSNPVRWVHVSELADIAKLLRGGELVLTTGVNLPDDPGDLGGYIADLVGAGTSGLVVELGRRFVDRLPAGAFPSTTCIHQPASISRTGGAAACLPPSVPTHA